ncbi:MAG: hypothetical protein U1B80_02430, partial [Anaerolineaceae bacterium]|nr:hypothetical protein [Anaerolineaceae bacterium]
MRKRLLLSCVTLLVVACVWVSLALIPAPFALLASRTASPPPSPVDTDTPTATPTSGLIPTQTAENLPPEIAREMDKIQQQVVELRGLAPRAPLLRQLLTPEQLRKKVSEDFFKDYSIEEAREDVLVMSVFGLLEPDYDLYTLYHELYSEQVAGYYDDESKTMYVVQERDFLGPQRTTYAHEFIHAVQDQHYDMQGGLKLTDEYCEQDSEYCAAVSALIEGDASLSERVWLWNYATEEDRQQIVEFYQGYQSPVFDAAPNFLKEDFLFPYIQGLEFVESLYDLGGWQAIDAAYAD